MRPRVTLWMRRIALGSGVLLIAILLVGMVYETSAGWLANRRLAAPGEMVAVGGHRLHWYCAGEGSPMVVLESGAGSWGSLAWRPVQTDLARTTRVCSYDRAGILWSERGPRPRSGAQAVSKLAILLEETGTNLAALSSNSPHVVVEDSDHFIHWSDPDRVIAAVRGVISRARSDSGRAMPPVRSEPFRT